MRIHRRNVRRALLLCVAVALPASARAQLKEAIVYGVAEFNGAGQCASGATHTVHTDTAAGFLDNFITLQATGDWDSALTRNNGDARGSYFTDASKATSCACTAADSGDYGADDADVFYIHSHGVHVADPVTGSYYSSVSMGTSSYDCNVRTDNNMFWGDAAGGGDLGFAVLKVCQSGDYDVWSNGGYRPQLTDPDSTFRMWNAFHGNSSCGPFVTTYVTSYASSSNYSGVGENWLDEAYDQDPGTNDDDCPVSIVMGESKTMTNELYEHGGWLDRKGTGDKNMSTIHYIAGCDPSAGITLPN
jgi:hypothetical protein